MRSSGVLLHISSLPSPYGIGTFGKKAYEFVDFLRLAGQKYWQVLPLCPTGYGDSPYQSICSQAGNTYFIDLDMLCDKKLLEKQECESFDWGCDQGFVDYGKLYENRKKVLRLAFERFDINDVEYNSFCKENADWLEDYALFAAIKDKYNGAPLSEWDSDLKMRDKSAIGKVKQEFKDNIEFYKTLQFWFYEQWTTLKKYANEQGIKIIGDLPIYISADGVDFWAKKELFLTDANGNPALVAGVPPDAFCEDGQLWGNPIYDWAYHKKSGYAWWIGRIKHYFKMFDFLRIDHFRGFESYYAISADSKTAVDGKWYKGPGIDLFNKAKRKLGELPIIAEDLGYITPELREFLDKTGFPGMNVLQFAFDPKADSSYLPYKHKENSVVYTGTHDNDTILGWLESAPKEQTEYAKKFLRLNEAEGYNWGMMKAALSSKAKICILTMQDLISADGKARMNVPGTQQGNWTWRVADNCINEWLAGILKEHTTTYKR